MRLTIKDLKIYLTIKDLKIYRKKKYNIKLQHYIRKGFFKKVSLQIAFKNLKIGGASKKDYSTVLVRQLQRLGHQE